MSDYYVSIKRHDGGAVKLRPGGHAERAIIADVIAETRSRSVGFFHTEREVLEAVEGALRQVLGSLKSDVLP